MLGELDASLDAARGATLGSYTQDDGKIRVDSLYTAAKEAGL